MIVTAAAFSMMPGFMTDASNSIGGSLEATIDGSTVAVDSSATVLEAASEDDLAEGNEHVRRLEEVAAEEDASVVMIAGGIEQELSQLDPEERDDFLADMGMGFTGLALEQAAACVAGAVPPGAGDRRF